MFKSDGQFLVSHCCDLALLFGGIAQYPFDLIAADSGLVCITRYDVREITARAESLGGALVQHYDMMRMEKDRTSGNAIFKTRESGWIEVCRFAI